MKRLISVFISFLYTAFCIDPLVVTSRGQIKGQDSDNGNYTSFLGIPYGVLDENKPFGKADPYPVFENTFVADNNTAECPQIISGQAGGTLDCLSLNVFVPKTADPETKLPVMIFIHGGAFVTGSKNKFGPKYIVKHEVILVTINYRIGLYGFLCLSDTEVNNQGFKDQLLALQWVKDNIDAFGGDVDKVTVFGQSAGAMSIDVLLLNSRTDLFSRAIVGSGPAMSPWVVGPNNDANFLKIANHFGFDDDNVTAAVDFLSSVDALNVMDAANDLNLLQNGGHPVFKPCVEGNSGTILQDYPVNMNPNFTGVDIMIGHTSNEIIFIYPNNDTDFYENFDFGNALADGFDKVKDEDIVRDFYTGENFTSVNLQKQIMEFGSDFAFDYPTDRTVERYLENGANQVYKYMFAYVGGRNKYKVLMNYTSEGAGHGEELDYLFDTPEFTQEPSDRDQTMINAMAELWTNFAKYGDPTPSTSDLIPVKWEPTTLESPRYLYLDIPLAMQRRPFSDRIAFWDLYYKLHGDVEKGRK